MQLRYVYVPVQYFFANCMLQVTSNRVKNDKLYSKEFAVILQPCNTCNLQQPSGVDAQGQDRKGLAARSSRMA